MNCPRRTRTTRWPQTKNLAKFTQHKDGQDFILFARFSWSVQILKHKVPLIFPQFYLAEICHAKLALSSDQYADYNREKRWSVWIRAGTIDYFQEDRLYSIISDYKSLLITFSHYKPYKNPCIMCGLPIIIEGCLSFDCITCWRRKGLRGLYAVYLCMSTV